jgi:hypothetical protein
MHWYNFADNPKSIASLFSIPPKLECVWVCCIELGRDGPKLALRLDIDEFPDHPPKKWAREYNQVQLTVDFFDVEGLLVEGWGRDNRARITVADVEGRRSVLVQGSECSIRFTCHVFRIAFISGYYDTEKPTTSAVG